MYELDLELEPEFELELSRSDLRWPGLVRFFAWRKGKECCMIKIPSCVIPPRRKA